MLRDFITDRRREKVIKVASSRQFSLNLILENIHDPHNVSAIFRTCEAVGVPKVSLLYNIEKFPRIGKKSSASAFKWVDKENYTEVDDCYQKLRKNGFKIYTSALNDNAVGLYELDLTEKCAIVLGNEHRGASEEAIEKADKVFKIPMFGMVQSLNVSVSAAIILYEALRQRLNKGSYNQTELDETEFNKYLDHLFSK